MPDREVDFQPQTAREALFEIRRRFAAGTICDDMLGLLNDIDRIAELGLARTEPFNFELNDRLGDKLAEAHKLLRRIERQMLHGQGGEKGEPLLSEALAEVLSLPPDLEAVVERRISPVLEVQR